MNLIDIVKADAAYMRHVVINVDTLHGWISIEDDFNVQDEIFLQGDDAEQFIQDAEILWNDLEHVTMDEVYAHLAKPYVDCIWN